MCRTTLRSLRHALEWTRPLKFVPTMKKIKRLLVTLVLGAVSSVFAAPSAQERPEWAGWFAQAPAVGTMVVLDARTPEAQLWVHNPQRAAQRFSPASTFKIPHALFALEAGAIKDEFEVIPWDGVRRGNPAWDKDQDLRSSMRNSTVWVYERFARQLGLKQETAFMEKIGYGNALSTGAEPFWVEGDLAISAYEKLDFLQKLYRNQLPFKVEHQRLVKDLMINEAGADWILRAKTGWSGTIGWWAGWVEWPTGPVFFVMNIDTPNRLSDLAKRQGISRQVLRSIQALPAVP